MRSTPVADDRARPSRAVVVHWIDHNNRTEGLARALGGDAVFMPWSVPLAPLPRKVADWVRSAGATWRRLRQAPAGTLVVVVGSPVFAALAALAVARRRGLPVAVDLHSGALNDRRWRWSFPLVRAALRAADLVIVTNREILEGQRIGDTEVAVIVDPWAGRDGPAPAPGPPVAPPYVLYPASGQADEPLEALAEAARLLPDGVEVVVTGRVQQRLAGAPVRTPGFVSRPELDALLDGASAVLALTTREATTQRSAFEALQRGCPVVCSDTRVLRQVCGPAAVFVDNTATGIAAGVEEALRRRDELAARVPAVVAGLRDGVEGGLAQVRGLQARGRRAGGEAGGADGAAGAERAPAAEPAEPAWGLDGPRRNRPLVRALLFLSKGPGRRLRWGRLLVGALLGTDLRSSHFGDDLFLPHPFGIVVHARVRLGDRCVLYQHVTLGEDNSRPGVPRLGDDVVVGAGAAVLGPVTVGDGARIGANAVVVDDVPAGAVAVGVPARIVGPRPGGEGVGRGPR